MKPELISQLSEDLISQILKALFGLTFLVAFVVAFALWAMRPDVYSTAMGGSLALGKHTILKGLFNTRTKKPSKK